MVVVGAGITPSPSSANTGIAVMTARSSPKRRARIVTSDEDLRTAHCESHEPSRLVNGGATPITGLRPPSRGRATHQASDLAEIASA